MLFNCGLDSSGSTEVLVACCSTHGTKHLGSIKDEKFFSAEKFFILFLLLFFVAFVVVDVVVVVVVVTVCGLFSSPIMMVMVMKLMIMMIMILLEIGEQICNIYLALWVG
jgi:hypothetical protein